MRVLDDLRYAIRQYKKNALTAVAIVVSIGLAVGANALMFTIISAFILKPLVGFRDPGSLAMISLRSKSVDSIVAYPDYRDFSRQQASFESLVAWSQEPLTLIGEGDPKQITAVRVTPTFHEMTKYHAFLGRDFGPADFDRGRDGVFLATAEFWKEHLGSDRNAVGRAFAFDGATRVLAGVLPPDFHWIDAPDDAIFVPLVPTAAEEQRGYRFFEVAGRLRTGVPLRQAIANFRVLMNGMIAAHTMPEGTEVIIEPLDEAVLGTGLRTALWTLGLTVFCVLLIASVNIATIRISRLRIRQSEIAMRAALGASRGQLVRLLTIESLFLALVGGCLGLFLAYAGYRLLQATDLLPVSSMFDGRVDWRVALFTLAASVLTAGISGLLPSLAAARTDLMALLRAGSGSPASLRRRSLAGVCIVAEVALSTVLIHGATMAMQNLRRLRTMTPGFESRNRLVLHVSLPNQRYRARARMSFFSNLIDTFNAIPGVQATAIVSPLPFSGSALFNDYFPDGKHPPAGEEAPVANYYSCSPGYFSTMRIPIVAGREFAVTDLQPNSLYAVVSRSIAVRFWGNEAAAIGHVVELNQRPLAIVGVAGDVRHSAASHTLPDAIYTLYSIYAPQRVAVVVRSTLPPANLGQVLRRSVWRIDSHLALGQIDSMDAIVGEAASDALQLGLVLGVCAAAALVMTLIGLYGVTSDMVSQRLREIAIRRALGASDRRVVSSLAAQGTSLALIGFALGAAATFAIHRVVASVVLPVGINPFTTALIAFTTLVTAVLASGIPSVRAVRSEPERILRQQ